MPYTTQTSDFWGWFTRHNNRVVWKHLSDAGIDVFASGPNNDTQAFLELTNILPSMNGGFNRRWGTTVYSSAVATTINNPVRTFLYNSPQDQSDSTNTLNTNLWITTDNWHFNTFTDSGTAYIGYRPSNFASSGNVGAVTSRQFFYYGNGYNLPRKIQLNYNTKDTDSLIGITIPSNTTGSINYADYPCVIMPLPSTSGAVSYTLQLTSVGTSVPLGTKATTTSGSGTGMTIDVLTNTGAGASDYTYDFTGQPGTGFAVNSLYAADEGSGSGLVIKVLTINSSGGILSASTSSLGSGYRIGDLLEFNPGHSNQLALVSITGITYSGSGVAAYQIIRSGSGYQTGDTVSIGYGTSWTVAAVISGGAANNGVGGTGRGYAANSNFTVAVSDISGSSGRDGVITCYTDSAGIITSAVVTSAGSSYTQAYVPSSAFPSFGTGGTQAYLVLYTETNSAAADYQKVVGVDLAGPMSFVSGRQYAVALQNSTTGHTSDVYVSQLPYGPTSGYGFNQLTAVYSSVGAAANAKYPVYVASANQTAGFTQLRCNISIPASGLDSQVDTVILLATSDGGSLGSLYQVITFPLSSFSLSGGFYTKAYYDTLPDSFNSSANTYGVSNTLLAADLWAYTDSTGTSYGILLNTPPVATSFLYPTIHQGRMFATDGKTVFFSKSLEEVTTSTGLITSKWEECWPGDYQLPVALNNESIIGLKSDGTALHIGTDKSIFTLSGDGPSNFSIPNMAFAQVGILSNDCWSVVYAEGMPSGYVWITQDYKIMYSDFSTYQEIGTSVYPIFQSLNTETLANAKVLALTQGPYNFVVFQFSRTGSSYPQPEFWIWESRLKKWYHWVLSSSEVPSGTTIGSSFIYQIPSYTSSSLAPGSARLFYWLYDGTHTLLHYFNPLATQDLGSYPISWSVQTAWQDCGDSTAIKVANEIEFTGDDLPLTVTLFGATSQGQFDSGGSVLKSGPSVVGPIAALGVNKFYCAGGATGSKYYSLGFKPVAPGTGPSVLSSFSLEYFPIARI